MHIIIENQANPIEIGKLTYGTIITGAPGHPGSVYIKVSKKFGNGIEVQTRMSNSSLILNLNSGTLRLIPGDSLVTVLDAELRACVSSEILNYIKSDYQGEYLTRRNRR